MKINLRFWKKNRFSLRATVKRIKGWVSHWPERARFVVSVVLLSALVSLLAIFLYDRLYGNSPISNRGRFVREAVATCNQSQTLAATIVGGEDWPIAKDYNLKGQSLDQVVSYLQNAQYYGDKNSPSAEEITTLNAWLQSKYADYFTTKSRCDEMATEYQRKYAY